MMRRTFSRTAISSEGNWYPISFSIGFSPIATRLRFRFAWSRTELQMKEIRIQKTTATKSRISPRRHCRCPLFVQQANSRTLS
jgi:hypothetical protein